MAAEVGGNRRHELMSQELHVLQIPLRRQVLSALAETNRTAHHRDRHNPPTTVFLYPKGFPPALELFPVLNQGPEEGVSLKAVALAYPPTSSGL